jgi:bacterioferritin-associated ferredoxin
MYVCVCKCLTDGDIRRSVFSGEVACMDTLRDRLGASTGCGSCELAARECLEEALAQKSSDDGVAPDDTRREPVPIVPGPELGDFSMA